MARCNGKSSSELPNLFLATSYALNKSNSKRICIGLEHSNGYFREVVKLISSGSWNKTVTLDRHSWDCFKDQFSVVDSFFSNSYAFYHDHGKPNKVYLPRHDLIFTTSYGTKSIFLEERPGEATMMDLDADDQPQSSVEPKFKKRKTTHPPGVVMQKPTYEGLRKQSLLIDLAFDRLRESVGHVNHTMNLILEYLEEKMRKKEDQDNNRAILSDMKAFEAFYAVLNGDIEVFVSEKVAQDFNHYADQQLKFVLAEIMAFGLSILMHDLHSLLVVKDD